MSIIIVFCKCVYSVETVSQVSDVAHGPLVIYIHVYTLVTSKLLSNKRVHVLPSSLATCLISYAYSYIPFGIKPLFKCCALRFHGIQHENNITEVSQLI